MSLTVSLDNQGQVLIHIPSHWGRGHSVSIPITLDGLRVLKKTLMEHDRDPRAKIGTQSAPTQAQIMAWLAAERTPTTPAPTKKRTTAEELGLTEEDFAIDM